MPYVRLFYYNYKNSFYRVLRSLWRIIRREKTLKDLVWFLLFNINLGIVFNFFDSRISLYSPFTSCIHGNNPIRDYENHIEL